MKRTWTFATFALAGMFALIPALHAQAVYAASESGHIQVGAGGLYLHNDYTNRAAEGISVWGDYDFLRYRRFDIGLEVAAHFGGLNTPDDIGENSYLVGPRLSYRRHRFNVYAKILVGRATITNQLLNQSSSYNVLGAYGGGLEYRATRKFNVRAIDLELQKWPDFEPHTLSPVVISVGVSYIIR